MNSRCAGGKRGKRPNAVRSLIGAVDDIIVRVAQVRDIEHVAQRESGSTLLGHSNGGIVGDGEMHRHRCVRISDFHRLPVIGNQEADLLRQVVFEQVGSCDSCCIRSGIGDMPEAKACIDLGKA